MANEEEFKLVVWSGRPRPLSARLNAIKKKLRS